MEPELEHKPARDQRLLGGARNQSTEASSPRRWKCKSVTSGDSCLDSWEHAVLILSIPLLELNFSTDASVFIQEKLAQYAELKFEKTRFLLMLPITFGSEVFKRDVKRCEVLMWYIVKKITVLSWLIHGCWLSNASFPGPALNITQLWKSSFSTNSYIIHPKSTPESEMLTRSSDPLENICKQQIFSF